MEISEILKSLRTDSGLTQKELSDHLKIGQATIACYENGQREPHIANLMAYADYFECSLDYLTGRTDDIGNIVIGIDKTRESQNALKSDERDLLEKYRQLSPTARFKLSGYIDCLFQN